MVKTKKKILYITNVNIEGEFLIGVIIKIKGQLKAFFNNGIDVDILYTKGNQKLMLKKGELQAQEFRGARQVRFNNFFSKLISHLKVAWYGSINFDHCYDTLVSNDYDIIYLRFYLPGKDLIRFLNKFKRANPSIKILLEYPTLNVLTELKKRDWVGKVTYYFNWKKILQLNKQADHIVTLTKDKILFGKPTIFMGNGITFDEIRPVNISEFNNEIILLGVTSDCAFYHGFDKVIKGLSVYVKEKKQVNVIFKIISSPLSKNVDYLKNLAKELGVDDMVSFELPKSRPELAEEYKRVHIGMGTLALHRINLMDNYSLKHREYAAFGLPFIMSKGDDHFEASPFVLTVERDEEPLNIQQVVDFYLRLRKNHPAYPQEFRNSVEDKITWNVQMKNVFEVINKA